MKGLLAIFDIDGTLVDSRAVITAAMKEAFIAQGYAPPSYDTTRSIVGLSLLEAIDKIAPRDADHEKVKALAESYKDAFVQFRHDGAEHEPIYPGGVDLLTRLKSDGWKIGVATGKSRRGLDALIEKHNFGNVFDAHYCADDGAGKPDPFMVEANLSALDVRPERAIMIGDTSFDMIMAVRAGVAAYGVNWGFHTEDEIKAGGANLIVNDMSELDQVLMAFQTSMHNMN